jgi:endonuclease YncB( thermonuclease family)
MLLIFCHLQQTGQLPIFLFRIKRMWKGMGCMAAIGFAFLAPAHAQTPGWEKLENCQFVEGRFSDGDSVEAEYLGQRYVFRLYFVDAIESTPKSQARRAGQAKYFGLTSAEADAQALQVSSAAADFTKAQLQKPFTVHTRWDRVNPKDNNSAIRAFVTTSEGADLSSQLVGEGLALILSGTRSTAEHPEGGPVDETLGKLRSAETDAHVAGRGAWAFSKINASAAPAPSTSVPAKDRKALLAHAGQTARVQGRINRVTALLDGRITFLSFDGNGAEDFVAIIRAGSLATIARQFPGGLEQALVGKDVTIEGTVTLYRDIPQIEISSPEQITVAPAQ